MRKFFSLITALVLCTAMWGAATYKTFYKVQGALYQGINVDFTTNKNMFVPNGATVTYSTFDGKPADWWANGKQKKTNVSYITIPDLADANYYKYQIKNYTGYDAQDPKIDYIYGTSSGDYLLRAGSGTMYMMSMANAYCVCTESTTASNVGKYYVDNKSMLTLSTADAKTYGTSMKYGTNFSYAKNGGLIDGYEMLLDNPGEMYIDFIVLPIFGYPKADTTTIAKMIPEGKKLTLTLYPIDLTLGSDGIYTYTRKTTAITSVTATAENFKQGDKVYDGTVKFDLSNNPLLISGDFVARLTWDEGCEFGLITDDNNLQNFTTFYLWKKEDGTFTKSYMWSSSSANASISYHAMFPVLEKKDTKTALEFTHEGGGDEVAIKSNIDPSSKDFSIDFGGADWISLDSLRYTTEGKYVAKETVYVVFKAEANTGAAREATITLKHHGKVLTYTVKQEAAPAPRTLYLNTGGSNLWNQSSAKFSAYYWADGAEGKFTDFLTAIEGNADIFVATIPADIKNVIFVRHANDATKAEWDDNKVWNQTTDLDISDDKDMYTITAWGEGTKVCSGEWSKYTKPAVTTYKDSVYYVAGNFTKWAAEMKKLPASVELPADSALEFKQVLTRTILADGDSIGQDTTWFGQANEGNKMTRESSAWTLDGEYNVLAMTDIAGKYTFSINEKGEFVLGWPKEPVITYKDSVYYVAGNFTKWAAEMKKLPAEVELPADSALEFKQVLTRTILADGDSIGQDTIWFGQANEGNKMTRESSAWTLDGEYNVLAMTDIAGKYTFSINEKGEFVLGWPEKPLPEVKYYAKNNWNGAAADDWSWLEMSATDQENIYMLDSVVFGGKGVNINDKADDADALYFEVDKIVVLDGLDGLPGPIPPKPQRRDTIPYAPAHSGVVLEAPQLLAGDTIKLFFNAADSTLKAAIVGRPEQPQPVEVKYYITGNAALCGEKAWDAQAIEMIDSTYTFTELAAGEYEMKITNGAWDPEGQSWGSAALSEECSAGVGDKDGNIHFIVETANDVTVSIANGSVTVTGTFKQVATGITVNVTVPKGTPACFFYGEMSGNIFVEMTKVDETHYTIDFPKATTIGWGYLFVWENGNWNTKNADPEGDIKVEPVEGVINVEIKAWVTAPGAEYKYTTYTEWQVKFGPAWNWVNMTKQEDGTFTVEAVWGNTGINIASGENPIKQDWYALDDPALTVEEGVVEGGNVVITLTVVNDETVALNVKKGQEPATPDFGLLVNGTNYLAGTPEDKGEYTEYAVSTTLAIGDFVQLYDNVAKAAWTVTPEGSGFTDFEMKNDAYYIKQAGLYQFYIKIPKEGMESALYVGFQASGTNLNNLKALDGKRYNILGQPVNETYRGIVIMNGQTYLQ